MTFLPLAALTSHLSKEIPLGTGDRRKASREGEVP